MTPQETTPQEGFPKELLNQSSEDRLAYFEQHTIEHPKLKKVFNQLLDAIDKPNKGSLLFVCGPTGVGKSKQILTEIEEGEKDFEETQKDRDELRSALGLTKIFQTQKPKKSNNKDSKVGQRKPTRDTIGQKKNAQ